MLQDQRLAVVFLESGSRIAPKLGSRKSAQYGFAPYAHPAFTNS